MPNPSHMAPHPSYPRTRLYVTTPLAQGATIELRDKQAHYLLQVLRFKDGDTVALFNGQDGEWEASVTALSRKTCELHLKSRLRPQADSFDLWLVFAPIKGGRNEWIIEKATELGVTRICPVQTQFTVADRINQDKFNSIAIEAAEQCERMSLPVISPLTPLITQLESISQDRMLIYGDESGASANARDLLPTLKKSCLAVLIGPEGGFSPVELALLRSLPYVSGMCLGPRVLRADTAAVAALTLVQALCGDWEGKPSFRS